MSILSAAHKLAVQAHEGQVDKLGVPYIEHVLAVSDGLVPFGDDELVSAGLLHDVLEDSSLTAGDLLNAGMPLNVVNIVDQVTNRKGVSYLDKISSITMRDAVLLKISDNAHNTRPDRLSALDEATRIRLTAKYRRAQEILWPKIGKNGVLIILSRVNPELAMSAEFDEFWSKEIV